MTRYNSSYSNTFPFSDAGAMFLLAASTGLSYTIPGTPSQIYRCRFGCSSSAEIWVSLNGTAVIPTSNTATASYNQEFIPQYGEARFVKGGDVLNFISTGTPEVGISLLQVQDIT